MGVRIWCERSNGFDFSTDKTCRKFPGAAHWFRDHTNLPAPTIDTKATRIVIEEVPDVMWLKNSPSAGFGQPPLSVETSPAPTIMAAGIGGVAIHQHYLEDDGIEVQNMKKAIEKPTYRVPTMAEIATLPWNGLTVASTFAGGGGSSLGYRMAGYRVLYANEFVEAARETYAANKAPYTYLDGRDIREVSAEDILQKIGMKPGELDVFDGSPPCASFSTAGKREKLWGKEKAYSDNKVQRVDDLFFEFTRLLRGLQPKVFVAENVKGLILGTAVGYFKKIHRELEDCGYVVEARLLNAKWLGVPQSRERTIFVGVRKDLGLKPAFPKPLPYYFTIRDAIPWIRRVGANVNFEQRMRDAGTGVVPTITATINDRQNVVEAETDISKYAVGDEWAKLKPGEQSDKYFQLVRSDPGKPVGTITAHGGSQSLAGVTHPYEKRKFTIPELKRLCSFPDDWDVRGSYAQQWERMGRAVPPLMMRAISGAIRDEIFGGGREHPASAKAA